MNQHEIDNELRTKLEEIKSVSPRDPTKTMRGRASFLNEALKIEATVSGRGFLRHTRWIPFGKEKLVMNAVISIIVIAGLLFGGGATVNAAQDDLPGQPLYGIKTASEDVSVQLENNPEAKIVRLMELAQIRIQEMMQLIEKGETPPDQVRDRLEQHLREALQTCTNLDDATLDRTLLQLRDQLRLQDRDMDQLQLHANPDAQLLLERTRTMLQLRLQVVEDGLLNHEQFRYTIRNGQEDDQTLPTPNGEQNTEQNREQNGQPTSSPGGSNLEPGGPNTDSGGPNADATPGPNNDNGSGNGTGTGSGNGSGDGSGGTGTGGSGTGGNGTGGNKP